MAKKNPGRFTVQFNLSFRRDLQAIKVLQSVPARGKAALIREALLLLNERDHLCDTNDLDDILEMVKNMPEQTKTTPSKPKKKEVVEEEFDENDGIVSLEYYDDDDEEGEDSEFDDVFADTLGAMMNGK
jgi:hypothetical protein